MRENSAQNDTNYIVKLPKPVKMIFSLVFLTGVILFFFFLIVKIKWGGGVTAGHLIFSLALAGGGLVTIYFSERWKVVVHGDRIAVYPLIRKKQEYRILEIERAEEGKEGELILYKDNKKIVTVESLAENYDRLRNTLKQHGKLKQIT